MSTSLVLKYPKNGSLRMYNMFPYRRYTSDTLGIKDMTSYLPEVSRMGYNAVWLNPFQLTGTKIHDHPDGKSQVTGSLYAMSDDTAFNPFIFSGCETLEACEQQIIQWTKTARLEGLFPLFDLVLNHIGVNEGAPNPLQVKLDAMDLLLDEINPRWPDIQDIDYYNAYKLDVLSSIPQRYTLYVEHTDGFINITQNQFKITYLDLAGKLKTATITLGEGPGELNLTQPLAYSTLEAHFKNLLQLTNSKGFTRKINHGLNAEPADLDYEKIDEVFKVLWEPLIYKYIVKYGFMGARIDALTHVPVPVLQRANKYIQELVQQTHGTHPILVGELMVGTPELYKKELSACGMTHTLHPCSFYWGHNMEGGYLNLLDQAPFLRQNQDLSSIVLPPPLAEFSQFSLRILSKPYNPALHNEPHAIYIHKFKDKYFFTLTGDSVQVNYGVSFHQELEYLETYHEFGCGDLFETRIEDLLKDYEKVIEELSNLKKYDKAIGTKKATIASDIYEWFSNCEKLKPCIQALQLQKNMGGLIGVMGNHDVGTLKAKIMLDLAYTRAMRKAEGSAKQDQLNTLYKEYKNYIKGITCTDDLMGRLQKDFELTEDDKRQLFLDLNFRIREKLFIQSMMCAGGWYSLGGDELGVCHKPEVFSEFVMKSERVGSSLLSRTTSKDHKHDFRGFISGINTLLSLLPRASVSDTASMHYSVLKDEVFGSQPADFLFMVVRYNHETKQFYLMVQTPQYLTEDLLAEKLKTLLADHPCLTAKSCKLMVLNEQGDLIIGKLKTAKFSITYEKEIPSSYHTEVHTEDLKSEAEDDFLEVTSIDGTELAIPKPINTSVHLTVAPTLAIVGVFSTPKIDKASKGLTPTIIQLS